MKSKGELAEISKKWRTYNKYESQGRGKSEAERANKKYAKQMERDYDDRDEDDYLYYKDLDNMALFDETARVLYEKYPDRGYDQVRLKAL